MTVEWEGFNGAYILEYADYRTTRWTAQFLGVFDPVPENCQIEGQGRNATVMFLDF